MNSSIKLRNCATQNYFSFHCYIHSYLTCW